MIQQNEGPLALRGANGPGLSGVCIDRTPILPATTNSGVARGEAPADSSPSLVVQGITQQITSKSREICAGGMGWIRGLCGHGTTRWVHLTCKRRDCPVCGEVRRRRIAKRIGYGLEVLGGGAGGAWFVGSFAWDVDKKQAIKVQAKFLRWVRKYLGDKVEHRVEYAVTWELTRKGRLHINIIMAPWVYIPQKLLSEKWQRFGGGRVVWIERVGVQIGAEVAKSKRVIGSYIGKFEQMVRTGKGVTYSKGWPKLPANELQRKGDVDWLWVGGLSNDGIKFEDEIKEGYWAEVEPGEWGFAAGEYCDCFDFVPVKGGVPMDDS